MSNVEVFRFEGQSIRTHVDQDGNPWWVARDICRGVDVPNVSRATSRLDDDERRVVTLSDDTGRPQDVLVVSESGMYSLVLSSRKPTAKRFKKWITSEVLPSIRKTGSYSVDQKQWAQVRSEGKQTRKLETAIIQSFISYAKHQGSQNADQYYRIFSKLVNSKLLEIEGKKPSNLRDHLNTFQLQAIATAEGIISRSIVECMNKGEHYKQAYQRAKDRIQIYASLVGVSKIGTSERQCIGLAV